MKQKLNIDNWNRKEHYHFFCQMEEPFFGITTTVDCTLAYETAKKLNVSFFIYYLHKTLVAVNSVEPFRYRIYNKEIYINDRIDASATIMREDNTFGFSLIEFNSDLNLFNEIALTEIERVKNTPGLFTREFKDDNLIHFSSLPWVNFTSLSHARSFTFPDSCPKISFGKLTEQNGQKLMSVSVHVHHGLMDGFHVGQFIDNLQSILKQ